MSYRVGYIGNYYRVPEYIFQSDIYELVTVVGEKDKLSNEMVTFSAVRNIPLKLIANKKQLIEVINETTVDFWIMCSFGKIIPIGDIENKKIYNIHYAMLPKYKGRHPTFWATMQGEKKIGISIHQITDKIDEGDIISQKEIPYYYWMNEEDLFNELTNQIPALLRDLFEYQKGNKNVIENMQGFYCQPVAEKDYTISLEKDSCENIYNKVRAQARYKGAKLHYNGKVFWIKKIEFGITELSKIPEDSFIIPYKNDLVLILVEYEVNEDVKEA